jgi:iron complex outermembrane receptor protein
VFYDANHATNINLQNAGNAAVPWFRAWDANPASPTYYENDNTDFATTNLSSLTADQLGFTTDHAAYAILNSSFFDGRLLLTGGARYNYTHSVATNYLSTAAPTCAHFSDTTPEVGLGFKVLPDLMVYGSYSTSYTPPSSAILTTISTVNGLPVSLPTGVASPTTGTGYEAGFKTSFLSGRISSTVSLYQIDQDDVVQSVSQVVSGYSVTTTLQGTKIRSRGAEAEITWSPADNLQIFASASEDDVRYSAEPLGYAYYLGTHPQYTSKTLANLWGRYTLKATPAKGLWVGGGFQYRSKSIANNNNEAFYVPDVTLWNSVVGYDWTWDRRKFSLQVHWENMTNTGDYITIYERGLPERVLATLDVRF